MSIPSPSARKLHRFTVKFVLVLGLIMIGTGTILKFPDLFPFLDNEQVRTFHSNTSTFFAPVLLLMMATGSYMYFYPWLSRVKIPTAKQNMWTIKLISKKEMVTGTMEFNFEKPAGFSHLAGQHLEWTLIDPPETDAEGTNRAFTISAAPFEDHLSFTTRMRDTAFKRVMKKMNIGNSLQIAGPEGDLVLPQDTNEALVLLAGGIGVTPFRSMALQAAHDKLPNKIFLFYSDHTPENTVYLEELTKLQSIFPNFKLIATMTEPEKSKTPWKGETGRLDLAKLKKYLGKDLTSYLYYTAGPPGLVSAMLDLLHEAKVPPVRILTENFTGY